MTPLDTIRLPCVTIVYYVLYLLRAQARPQHPVPTFVFSPLGGLGSPHGFATRRNSIEHTCTRTQSFIMSSTTSSHHKSVQPFSTHEGSSGRDGRQGVGGHVGLITGQGHERDSLFPSAMPEKDTKNNENEEEKEENPRRIFPGVSKKCSRQTARFTPSLCAVCRKQCTPTPQARSI